MKQEDWSIPYKSVQRQPRGIQTKEEKNSLRDGLLTCKENERLKDQRQASFM